MTRALKLIALMVCTALYIAPWRPAVAQGRANSNTAGQDQFFNTTPGNRPDSRPPERDGWEFTGDPYNNTGQYKWCHANPGVPIPGGAKQPPDYLPRTVVKAALSPGYRLRGAPLVRRPIRPLRHSIPMRRARRYSRSLLSNLCVEMRARVQASREARAGSTRRRPAISCLPAPPRVIAN